VQCIQEFEMITGKRETERKIIKKGRNKFSEEG
jgi:hypothetical protein